MMKELLPTIASITLTAMTALMTWIANTLAGLRKDLNKKVDRYDCNRSMDQHCARLTQLENDVRINVEDIAELRARIDDRITRSQKH